MDQVMSDVFEADHNSPEHDRVEGFRVPTDHKDAGSSVDSRHNVGSDTNIIEQRMAQVTLSDSQQTRPEQQQQQEQGDHSMRRSGSSMSMDTQP